MQNNTEDRVGLLFDSAVRLPAYCRDHRVNRLNKYAQNENRG